MQYTHNFLEWIPIQLARIKFKNKQIYLKNLQTI